VGDRLKDLLLPRPPRLLLLWKLQVRLQRRLRFRRGRRSLRGHPWTKLLGFGSNVSPRSVFDPAERHTFEGRKEEVFLEGNIKRILKRSCRNTLPFMLLSVVFKLCGCFNS
jgi:hypothetical protein